jgi:hypothetical protein
MCHDFYGRGHGWIGCIAGFGFSDENWSCG